MALSIGADKVQVVSELPTRPKRKGNHGRTPSAAHVDLADGIRSHAGEWVFIGTAEKRLQGQALAFRIRKGKSAAFKPEGAFQAETRFNEHTGETDIFVKYVGPIDGVQLATDDVTTDNDDEWGNDE